MRTFLENPPELYKTAVKLLRELAATDFDAARRACAEVLADKTYKNFKNNYFKKKIKETKRKHACENELSEFCYLRNEFGFDHTSFWTIDGKKIHCILTQPYHLHDSSLKKMLAFAEKYKFNMAIEAHESYHFPSSTISVIFYDEALE